MIYDEDEDDHSRSNHIARQYSYDRVGKSEPFLEDGPDVGDEIMTEQDFNDITNDPDNTPEKN